MSLIILREFYLYGSMKSHKGQIYVGITVSGPDLVGEEPVYMYIVTLL